MKHILTLALMALSIMVQGQERILLGEHNGDKHYIYPSTIRKGNYGITVWQEWIYAKPRFNKETNKYYTSSKAQELIDCNGYRRAPIAITYYSKNGNVINRWNWSEWEAFSKLSPQAPGSIGWHMIEETCKRYNRGY